MGSPLRRGRGPRAYVDGGGYRSSLSSHHTWRQLRPQSVEPNFRVGNINVRHVRTRSLEWRDPVSKEPTFHTPIINVCKVSRHSPVSSMTFHESYYGPCLAKQFILESE